MHVPRNRWTNGGWNEKLSVFLPLARWFGIHSKNPTVDDLQALYKHVPAKVFAESVSHVLEATGMDLKTLVRKSDQVWSRLGLGAAIPPRSLMHGRVPATQIGGVALLAGGTTSWMWLRWKRLQQLEHAGAKFERIIVLGSSRPCSSDQDWRHPYIREVAVKGREPNEREVWRQWLYATGQLDRQYVFPDLPMHVGDEEWLKVFAPPVKGQEGKPLSLEHQLSYLKLTGQFDEYVGERPITMTVNGGNALFAVLHTYRVLELEDITFSMPATNTVSPVPDEWWSEDQDCSTILSGMVRLWIELRANGCINDEAKP